MGWQEGEIRRMKIEKLKAELEKAWQKAAEWQAKARDLEKQVTEQENLQIIQAVRGITASPEELGDILGQIRSMKGLRAGGPGMEEKGEEEKSGSKSGEGEKDE